ncbi:uncharacterized protein LOC123258184 [Drosophila ananassae]|uniref:uncharacterized protein LOC123258184 n=1 Tax=Drosophila ananassae TaxID=7217 RepID=UPI001CFFF6A6|nr:uncharacterized protein LOC123258184 [Drosophila ananassae]
MDTVIQDNSVAIAETVLLTDSKTVLRWIGSTHRRYKQFVGNRVAEILKSTKRGPKRGVALVKRTGIPEETKKTKSYRRLLRTTAWVLKFIRRCRGQRDELENYGLNVAECEAAEDLLVRKAQREAFPDEMQAAEKGLDVAKGSDICGLAPYLDGNGVLRAYGRIDAALCIPYSARRPVILSHRHGLTKMIMRDANVRMRHQNMDATMAEIRTMFWIMRLWRVLRSVISDCSECKLHRARPMPPIMGPLPDDRLDANGWPFKSTVLDYFRSLLVTVARHQEKRLRSDNGRNFVGADREAKRFAEIFKPERIQSELSSKGIEWIFNCPANPSEGGVWERMVQCVKRVLRHTVKEVAPKEHVLESFLIEAENVVNSCPLTHLPVSADQEAPLTPNDLLKGTACPPDTPGLDGGLVKEGATRKQWRVARMLRNRFCRRWVLEYLPTLTRREKGCRREKPIQRGDIVFVCDPAVPRRDWRKGVVDETFAGTEGGVRRARVRIMDRDRTRWIMRPASKLEALDLSEEVLQGGGDVADRLSISSGGSMEYLFVEVHPSEILRLSGTGSKKPYLSR